METQLAQYSSERQAAKRPLYLMILSLMAGFVLTTIWSYRLVDAVIGNTILVTLLGEKVATAPITGTVIGALFAFASGIAGTFTACNICAFSALIPMTAEKQSLGKTIQPLLYLGAGLVIVAGSYGVVGALWGPSLPQLSTDTIGTAEFPLRLVQSAVVFVSIGLVMIFWGITSLGLVRNPFATIAYRYPWLRLLAIGGLVGGFLIGRPFPPFRKLFSFAAATHNPFYGALVFILQAIGNVTIMILLFLLLRYGVGGRFERWLYAHPDRAQTLMAILFIAGGAFFVSYWGFRVPAAFGIGWWPTIPW